MTQPEILVSDSATTLVRDIAARLIQRLTEAQQQHSEASLVLTGGRVGTAALAAVRDHEDRDTVEWGNVQIWWSDERFVPSGSRERNAAEAFEALLSHVPVSAENVHIIPSSEDCDTLEEAARAYSVEISAAAAHNAALPRFDVLLLGVGEDGHVASLFPHSDATRERETIVAAVHDSPKPPPRRITWTFPAINSAREVWLLASGEAKAGALSAARAHASRTEVPAAGAGGRERTVWMCDRAAIDT